MVPRIYKVISSFGVNSGSFTGCSWSDWDDDEVDAARDSYPRLPWGDVFGWGVDGV